MTTGQAGRAGLTTLALVLFASPVFAATKAIRAGKVLDSSGRLVANAVVVIDNDRITSIETTVRDLGAIAPGYFADLVAVDAAPLSDIAVVVDRVRWVMKAGAVVVDRTGAGGSDAVEIRAFVERFLLALGDHDVDTVAADLAPKALIVVTRERDGQWTNSLQTGEEWIAAMRRNAAAGTFREPLANVTVTIDSDHLAHVRADFQILRDGKAQSHGVDQFTLVREPSGWKFSVIAYTSMPVQ